MSYSIYTRSERTEKKYTVLDAIRFAGVQLKSPLCTDCLKSLTDWTTPITLERANEIADQIVKDTLYRCD